jgi:hypothetical protein
MRKTLEWAVAENGAEPYEETVMSHTTLGLDGNTLEARVIIAFRDKDGNEWLFNDTKKFRMKLQKGPE